jgi:hypothetical protein
VVIQTDLSSRNMGFSIAEFEYLLLKSPTNALNGRLMDPYAVTEVSRTTEGFEMTHGRDSAYLAL